MNKDAARKDALRRDAEYTGYIKGLQSAGYFQEEAEDSYLWNVLEDKAIQVYVQTRQEEWVASVLFRTMTSA